jgi:hypothetical protein
MTKTEFEAFVQEQVALLRPKAANLELASGQRAKGKLIFFEALVAAQGKSWTPEQFGLLDAVNDTLQEIGTIKSDMVFYNLE